MSIQRPRRPCSCAADETDPLRKFYTSLLRQRPGSHMANDWCIRRGLLPRREAAWAHALPRRRRDLTLVADLRTLGWYRARREQAEEWLRVNRPGALTPKKPRNAAPRKRVKKEDGEDTPKKAFARKGGKVRRVTACNALGRRLAWICEIGTGDLARRRPRKSCSIRATWKRCGGTSTHA